MTDQVDAGLCAHCTYVHINHARRNTTYYRCTRAAWDHRLTKYPSLPVTACLGYDARTADRPD